MNEEMKQLLEEIRIARNNDLNAPRRIADRTRTVSLIKMTQVVLLPGYYHYNNLTAEAALEQLAEDMKNEMSAALQTIQNALLPLLALVPFYQTNRLRHHVSHMLQRSVHNRLQRQCFIHFTKQKNFPQRKKKRKNYLRVLGYF